MCDPPRRGPAETGGWWGAWGWGGFGELVFGGAEAQFGEMRKFWGQWWWWLHKVNVLNALELYT